MNLSHNKSGHNTDINQLSKASSFLKWNFGHPAQNSVADAFNLYYNRYYQSPDEIEYVWKHYDSRLNRLKQLAMEGKKIIEIGCGIGMNSLFAALHGGRIHGVEVKPYDVTIANMQRDILEQSIGRKLDCRFECANIMNAELKEQYDVVFMQEAFHHLEPRNTVVGIIDRVLKPGGILLCQESNAYNPVIQAKLFKFRQAQTIIERKEPESGEVFLFGNERILTAGQMTRRFARVGIQCKRTRFFRILPTSLSKRKWLATLGEFVENKLENSILNRPVCLHYEWEGNKSDLKS